MNDFSDMSVKVEGGRLYALDQRKLPQLEEWCECKTVEDMWQLIKQLSVRGAPLIAVGALLSLGVAAGEGASKDTLIQAARYLKTSRPTAVNMMTACDAVVDLLQRCSNDEEANVAQLVCAFVQKLVTKEIEMNDSMAKFGASLIQPGEGILTHCNTGSLATPGKGTALGVIKEAFLQNKNIHVYVDETRPLLQGARLTAYELQKAGIPYTLICDNMAACLMKQGKINRVLVGADRIATNGDSANKIGTYSLAIVCNYHKVPFHIVAPTSTIDFECSTGSQIPIEERSPEEVLGVSGHFGKVQWAPSGAKVYNPAFDVTPVELIASIILDTGVYTKEQINQGAFTKLKQPYHA